MNRFGALALFLLASTPLLCGSTIFTASLTGVGTSNAFAVITLDGTQGQLDLSFNLSSALIAGSGIYDESETTLLYPLTLPQSPASSGALSQLINFTSQDATTLAAGELYFDLLTVNFPSVPGEVGGELIPAPEPGSMVLFVTGLAAASLIVYRRRRLAQKPAASRQS
jgi:hypothetical protein